jgi:putative endonuclease
MAKNGHITIGQLGENIAIGYLCNRGFRVVERNYRKKWGEIDIVAEKDNVLHFVEVKAGSVTDEFPQDGKESYRPEDHVDQNKKARLERAIKTYIQEKRVLEQGVLWTLDVLVVHIHKKTQHARVTMLKNVQTK